MQIAQTEVVISTPDGQMPAFLAKPAEGDRHSSILLLMEAFGLTSHIREIAVRLANEGYVVLTPDLYYRESPHNKFGYDEVEPATAMMWNLDFGQPMEEDIRAALNYLKSCSQGYPNQIGVTGFCLGGGLTFFTACKFSGAITPEGELLRIAAAAPFYGMVLDEWIDAIPNITVPMYLFFGGIDPFIPLERIQFVESRFQEFGKEYTLEIYPEADHGFFCHERSSYNRAAAEDSWQKLIQFFRQHLLFKPPG
jgi:carboxymethylenebutenolidase